jgi:hypothetical protein
MVLFQLSGICNPVGSYHQGWEKPNFFWPMHWHFGFNAKNMNFANKTMSLFQLLLYVFVLCLVISNYL